MALKKGHTARRLLKGNDTRPSLNDQKKFLTLSRELQEQVIEGKLTLIEALDYGRETTNPKDAASEGI